MLCCGDKKYGNFPEKFDNSWCWEWAREVFTLMEFENDEVFEYN